MDNIYVYEVQFPVTGINEAVCTCPSGGYCVYLDSRLSPQGKVTAFEHALDHIRKFDFENRSDKDIQQIESDRHEKDGSRTTTVPSTTQR